MKRNSIGAYGEYFCCVVDLKNRNNENIVEKV